AVRADPFGVQPVVDHRRRGSPRVEGAVVPRDPGMTKCNEPAAAALGAGAMTCGQPGGLIEEEKLGIAVRGHDRPLSPLELEQAQDPSPKPPVPEDAALLVVEDAPIAQIRPPLRGCDDLAEWRDAVPPRHGLPSGRSPLAPDARGSLAWPMAQ